MAWLTVAIGAAAALVALAQTMVAVGARRDAQASAVLGERKLRESEDPKQRDENRDHAGEDRAVDLSQLPVGYEVTISADETGPVAVPLPSGTGAAR